MSTPVISVVASEIASHCALLGIENSFSNVSCSPVSTLPKGKTAVLVVGDNLTSLSRLSSALREEVHFCYIDPPYNTSSKFLYDDSRVSIAKGVFGKHAAWMEFILPRLVLAKYTLKKDGVIAISIDDYEYPYLKVLMDTVYGEENFIANFPVCRSKNGKGSKKNVAVNHEYLLVYGNSSASKLIGKADALVYDKCDKYGDYRTDGLFRKKGAGSLRSDRPNMYYPVYCNTRTGEVSVTPQKGWKEVFPRDSSGVERRWVWGKSTAGEREWQLYSSPSGVVYIKNYACPENQKRIKLRTHWDDPSYYTEKATNEIVAMFGSKIFDTPKSLQFITNIIDAMCPKEAVVLDFFAGSGTTAQAVAVLNSRSVASNRKVILMEEQANIPAGHMAYKAGFRLISDITGARLQKVKAEYKSFDYEVVRM